MNTIKLFGYKVNIDENGVPYNTEVPMERSDLDRLSFILRCMGASQDLLINMFIAWILANRVSINATMISEL